MLILRDDTHDGDDQEGETRSTDGWRVNLKQRWVLGAYVAVVAVLGFFWVPWRNGVGNDAGYAPMFDPPPTWTGVELDLARVAVTGVVATLITVAFLALFRD